MFQLKLLTPILWLLALLLAGWTLAQLPLGTIMQSVTNLSVSQLILWLGLNLLIVLLCNYRWLRLNALVGQHPGFLRLLLIRQAGQAVSFITPGPQFGGEPLQVYWLYRLCGQPLGKTILALGLDRFFELFINFSVLLLGLAIVLLYSQQNLTGWPELVGMLVLLIGLLFGIVWLLLRQPQWMSNRLQRLAQRWHKHPRLLLLETGFQTMGENLRVALSTQKSVLLQALLLSLVSWGALLLELDLVLGFAEIHADLPAFFLILISMRLAILVPLPGAVGTLELSLLWAIQSLGYPAGAALGVIAMMRLRDVIVLGAGLLCLRLVQNRYRLSAATTDIGMLKDVGLPG
ncbi:MAG: lysylphosphatidylglycerol synthase transmembrane domain-containing protein [Pseudomonadota bacterium]